MTIDLRSPSCPLPFQPTCANLEGLLENWSVDAPGMWENDIGPTEWYAVSNDVDGIVAYFLHEADARRVRLSEINRILNG